MDSYGRHAAVRDVCVCVVERERQNGKRREKSSVSGLSQNC